MLSGSWCGRWAVKPCDCCFVDVCQRRCSDISPRALSPHAGCPWSPTTAVRVNSLHSTASSSDLYWTAELRVQRTYLRELCVLMDDVRGRPRLWSVLPRSLHSTASSSDLYWTAELRVPRTCSVEQSATSLARKHVTGYI